MGISYSSLTRCRLCVHPLIFRHKLHERSDELRRSDHRDDDPRLFHFRYFIRLRKIAGIEYRKLCAVRFSDDEFNARDSHYERQEKFPFQPFTYDVHVKQAQEAAAETIAQDRAELRLI
jgi:hypothetical protein